MSSQRAFCLNIAIKGYKGKECGGLFIFKDYSGILLGEWACEGHDGIL